MGNYMQHLDCLHKFSLLRLALIREQPSLMRSSTVSGMAMTRAEVGWKAGGLALSSVFIQWRNIKELSPNTAVPLMKEL